MKQLSTTQLHTVTGSECAFAIILETAVGGLLTALGTAVVGPIGAVAMASVSACIARLIGPNEKAISDGLLDLGEQISHSGPYHK